MIFSLISLEDIFWEGHSMVIRILNCWFQFWISYKHLCVQNVHVYYHSAECHGYTINVLCSLTLHQHHPLHTHTFVHPNIYTNVILSWNQSSKLAPNSNKWCRTHEQDRTQVRFSTSFHSRLLQCWHYPDGGNAVGATLI